MRFVCGDMRDLIVSPEKPRTCASALQSVATVEASKKLLSEIFGVAEFQTFARISAQSGSVH